MLLSEDSFSIKTEPFPKFVSFYHERSLFMLKDIPFDKVKNIGIAIVKEQNDLGEEVFNTYIINFKSKPIDTVLITSKGYGTIESEKKETSTLRYHIKEMGPQSWAKFEPIDPALFMIFNEFWVSFRCEGAMFDKKFLFVPHSVTEENFIDIPFIEKKGVLIR